MHPRRKFDALRVGQTEHLVVIEDGVQVFNPNGVDGAVTDDPLMDLI